MKPICLPSIDKLAELDQNTRKGSEVNVAGFGATNGDGQLAETIQHATLKIVQREDCSGGHYGITGDQLCAMGESANICQVRSKLTY